MGRDDKGSMDVWAMVVLTFWLFCISIMDIRKCRVPVGMLAIGGGLSVLVLACRYYVGEIDYFNVLKGILPGALLLLIAFVTKKAGYGDGIVLLVLGVAAGGGKSLLFFGLSLLLICIWSILLLALRKAGHNTKIPYVPFLAAAWLAVMIL